MDKEKKLEVYKRTLQKFNENPDIQDVKTSTVTGNLVITFRVKNYQCNYKMLKKDMMQMNATVKCEGDDKELFVIADDYRKKYDWLLASGFDNKLVFRLALPFPNVVDSEAEAQIEEGTEKFLALLAAEDDERFQYPGPAPDPAAKEEKAPEPKPEPAPEKKPEKKPEPKPEPKREKKPEPKPEKKEAAAPKAPVQEPDSNFSAIADAFAPNNDAEEQALQKAEEDIAKFREAKQPEPKPEKKPDVVMADVPLEDDPFIMFTEGYQPAKKPSAPVVQPELKTKPEPAMKPEPEAVAATVVEDEIPEIPEPVRMKPEEQVPVKEPISSLPQGDDSIYGELAAAFTQRKEQLDYRENLLARKQAAIDSEKEQLARDKMVLTAEKQDLESRSSALKTEMEENNRLSKALTAQIEELQKKENALAERELQTMKKEQSVNDRSKNVNALSEKLKTDKAEYEKSLRDTLALKADLEEREETCIQTEQRLDLKKKQLEMSEASIASKMKDLKEMEALVSDLEKSAIPQDVSGLEKQIADLESKLSDTQNEKEALKAEATDAAAAYENIRTAGIRMRSAYEAKLQEKDAAIGSYESKVSQMQEQLEAAHRDAQNTAAGQTADPEQAEKLEKQAEELKKLNAELEEAKGRIEKLTADNKKMAEVHSKRKKERTRLSDEDVIKQLSEIGITMEKVPGEADILAGSRHNVLVYIDHKNTSVICIEKAVKRNHSKLLDQWNSESITESYVMSQGKIICRKLYNYSADGILEIVDKLKDLK